MTVRTGAGRRHDAAAVRARLLRAAAEIFAADGLLATQAEIAARAGVGVATVYRQFATKDHLIHEVYEARLEGAVDLARRAGGADRAWDGLVDFVRTSAENLAHDRGLRELVLGGFGATLGWSRRSAPHVLAQLLRATDDEVSAHLATAISRAKDDGDLRGDFEVTDVQLVTAMVQAAATLGRRAAPELHRRAAAVVLDGLRAARTGSSTLPAPALTRDQLEQLTERAVDAAPLRRGVTGKPDDRPTA